MIKLIFGFLMISYVWMIYGFLLTRKEIKSNYYRPVSVIIPCYNENKTDLVDCVSSVFDADGEKEVILVNNNTKIQETYEGYEILKNKYPNLIYLEQPIQGKRFAHSKGLEVAKNDLIVFIDSDTLIHKDALIEIVKPFEDDSVGGVAGKVLLHNKNQNFITRSIDSMFWTSGSVFRNATGNRGFMQVSAGALSAYKKSSLMKLEDDYLKQTFMGRPCAISDDRYLTMRVQTILGEKIRYTEKAISYTVMPHTFMGFWKVLERWKRGVIREVLMFWTQPKKKAKMLFLDTQFNFLALNVMMVFKFVMFYNLIFNFSALGLLSLIFWLVLMSVFYGSYMLVKNPKDFGFKILYTLFYELFWSFSYFNALWNIRNQGSWMTR